MKSVGLNVLKKKLSEYIRLAAAGETVLVTDRDRVVAQITAPDARLRPLLADTGLAEASRKGWMTPPALQGRGPLPATSLVATLAELVSELDVDRAGRW